MKLTKWMTAGVACTGVVAALMSPAALSAEDDAALMKIIEEGKAIAFNKKKGNCLACHRIEGGKMAGDIAPPILMMKMRYPDKARLRLQIWDVTRENPATVMPPFGRHRIMSESEIDKVTEFIYSL